MNRMQLRGSRSAAALVSLAMVFAAVTLRAAPPAAAGSATYSARAIALRIDGVTQPVSGPIIVCDTGPLPASGGALSVGESNVNIANGGLTIDQASATAFGGGAEASADATLSGYRVEFLTEEGHRILIEADYIYTRASTTVARNGKVESASEVKIQNLRVNGRVIAVTGRPNQVVEDEEEEWKLVLNVKTSSEGRGSGDSAAAAFRFEICHCIFGHIGVVQAGLTVNGTPPPPDDCGKVTGGGWIVATGGEKGTFGMSGGIRRGEFWGHLNYIDHGTGMKVQSTAVTGFQFDPTDPDGRIINYKVTINGAPGTARLRVVDNGEPGRDDIFDLTLSSGYHATGDLGGGRPGGGNIQNHKCPPGWE